MLLLSSAQQESADAQGDESLVTEDWGGDCPRKESLIVLQIIDSGISTQSVLGQWKGPRKGGVPQTSADAADGSLFGQHRLVA